MDNNILSMLSYGMYIVCSEYENKKAGCVVNTLTQISENPDMVAVSIRKQSETGNGIEKSGRFTASILGKNADMDMV
ncbi:MAG: flavin reductase, partial [Clostridia bacterium]|nr:flavin reductase [Clostridia bacterium]